MISAGEASGDLHGASLVRAAHKLDPEAEFFGLGGCNMAEAGVRLISHLSQTAVMGLTEVMGSLYRILKIRRNLARLLVTEKPQALVLIDSPDFNFYLAKKAFKQGIPVIYYICPQIWAWRQGRLKFLAKYISRRAVIFPFELDFYTRRGVTADLVGHPLLDELPARRPQLEIAEELGLGEGPILAILPGSRRSVAERLTSPMLKAAELLLQDFPDLRPVIPRAQSLSPEFLDSLIKDSSPKVLERLKVTDGNSQNILAAARAALLASGTSTVEGTLLGTPMVVAYKTSGLSFFLARHLVKVPFISITNLLLNRLVIPELIQAEATPENMARSLKPYLTDSPGRSQVLEDLQEASVLLGSRGASRKTAELILSEIRTRRRGG
jgi:lipid-A-disaccharide synthase